MKHLAWEKVENTREICTQWDGKRRIEEVDRGDRERVVVLNGEK